ncbi:endoribonuclease L-PSP [Gluconobacter wancherniae]|uniref:endoribonuclease L-PSP n=1 Tax=Gluconobacter wancherniae TaxID=1307955 RepID=UPI0030A2FA65
MGTFSTNENVTVHGDEVTCIDFNGMGPVGDRPQRLSDECRVALQALTTALADHSLTLQHTRHIAAMLRSGDDFAQCQNTLHEALAPAHPALTLRIVQKFPHPDQRIALSVIASPHPF